MSGEMKTIVTDIYGFTDAGLRDRAVIAARGDAPFDILITGGTLVDMVTGELRAADIGNARRDQPSAARASFAENLPFSSRMILEAATRGSWVKNAQPFSPTIRSSKAFFSSMRSSG